MKIKLLTILYQASAEACGLKLKILLGQLYSKLGDVEGNIEKIVETVRSHDADLAVFPEQFLAGYYSKDIHYRAALNPYKSPLIERLRKAAEENKTAIIAGFPEKSEYGIIYNSALAINEQGEIHIYRKRHLPTFSVFNEYRWFGWSRNPLKTWSVKGVKSGIAICYDTFFPEIFKAYTLMGAKMLVIISASPDSSLKFFQKLTEARAIENTVYTVWVNLVGIYEGIGFAGGSRIISPLGRIVTECRLMDEDIKIAEIDFDEVDYARIVRPTLRDSIREDAEELLDAYLTLSGKHA